MGNYKDSTLEKLADKGNGNYADIGASWKSKPRLTCSFFHIFTLAYRQCRNDLDAHVPSLQVEQ